MRGRPPGATTPTPRGEGALTATAASDGVLDSADHRGRPRGDASQRTVRVGCPAPDNDHDNIIDQPEGPDRCPDQAETFNGVQDDDGCPDGAVLAEMSGGEVRILQAVNFRTDRDEIVGAQSFQVLDSVVGDPPGLGRTSGSTSASGSPRVGRTQLPTSPTVARRR